MKFNKTKVSVAVSAALFSVLSYADCTTSINSNCSFSTTPTPQLYTWSGGSVTINAGATVSNPTTFGNLFTINSGQTVGDFTVQAGATASAAYGNNFNVSDVIYNNGGSIGNIVISGTLSDVYSNGVINNAATNSSINSITVNSTGLVNGVIAQEAGILNNTANTNITSISNYGVIQGSSAIENSGGTIGTINNYSTGVIAGYDYAGAGGPTSYGSGIGVWSGTINTINNSGQILGDIVSGQPGINNQGTIGTINNTDSAVIRGGPASYGISNGGTISTINNTGSAVIQGGTGGYGINNTGTITNLNNAQGGTATPTNVGNALTQTGNLPLNYNIIISNASHYGQLVAYSSVGTMTFGISSLSPHGSSALGTYLTVLNGVTSSALGGSGTTINGSSNGYTYRLVETSAISNIWDLTILSVPNPTPTGPDAANTLQSVQMNSGGLAALYNQQAAAYQAALSYDCQVYDENGMCVSVGGRYTYAGPSPSANAQSGLVILGYRPIPTVRLGAFADQSVNVTTPTGFKQNNNSPMWGLFAKWHMNKDETGLGVQASAVTSASSLNVTRSQLTNTEAGSGTTQYNGQGYQLTTNYHQPVTDSTAVVPYIGLRYSRINAGAYTENTTANVSSPLSYNAMAQNTFSAIGGVGVRSHLAEKLIGTASVGIQQNLKYSMGNYQGTSSISGLESFSIAMPGNVNSMATASAGLYYNVRKNERVGVNVLWQQQPFIATNTTTALATYTIGF